MFNNLIKYTLVIFFLSGFSVGCADAQIVPKQGQPKIEPTSNMDLSTDAAVLAELQKIKDAKIKTTGDEKLDAKIKNARKLEAKDFYIKRIKDEEIIVIGFFRTDVGCLLDAVFIDSRYFERKQFDLSKLALAALGWEKATKRECENLARIWVEKGLLVFAPLPNQSLSAISTGDGNVKVTASSKYPAGVTSRSKVKSFVFDKDGGLLPGSGY